MSKNKIRVQFLDKDYYDNFTVLVSYRDVKSKDEAIKVAEKFLSENLFDKWLNNFTDEEYKLIFSHNKFEIESIEKVYVKYLYPNKEKYNTFNGPFTFFIKKEPFDNALSCWLIKFNSRNKDFYSYLLSQLKEQWEQPNLNKIKNKRNSLKFKDCEYDSRALLDETKIGTYGTDENLYTEFEDFNENVINSEPEILECPGFDRLLRVKNFNKLLSLGKDSLIDVDFDDGPMDDWRFEKMPCKEISFDDYSPIYIQIVNLTENDFDIVKEYLTAYDWRFVFVGFFRYEDNDYIYLLCNEEN